MNQYTVDSATRPTLVVLGLRDHQAVFQSGEFGMAVAFLDGCRELRQYLFDHPRIDVVVTSTSLRDGNWCDVLTCLLQAENTPALILCTSKADETLWSEAIWRGVHDVLTAPLELHELTQSVASATRSRVPGGTGEREGLCKLACAG